MVTTGGTGPAPRDVTPDATEAVSFLVPILGAFRCCSSRAFADNTVEVFGRQAGS